MKIGWKRYFEPTPKRFRVLGDSLAAGSLFVAGLSIMTGHEKIAIGVAIAGWLGKFLSNFFADENTTNSNSSNQL